METVGQRIAAARGAKGLTQTELAEAIGRTYQQVSAWERSDTALRTPNLYAVAQALKVRPEWIRTGDGPISSVISMATGAGKTSAAMATMLGQILAGSMTPGYGARIKKALKEAGLEPPTAMERLQISKKRLALLEKEEEEPTPAELMAIAMETGTNIRWIATGRSLPKNDEAHEADAPYRETPTFDRGLLARALRAALSAGPKAPAERLVDAAIDAYEIASKPGRSEKIEELVKALLL